MSEKTVWEQAQEFRQRVVEILPTKKVSLDPNPASNIGGLHSKLAEVRDMSNEVRDMVFKAMIFNSVLRRASAEASLAYDQAMGKLVLDKQDDPKLKSFKTKEEREVYLRQSVKAEYNLKNLMAEQYAEWELFMKMVNLVYYSLSHARDDISTQVALIKQQAFKGEIQMDPSLKESSSFLDFLGEKAKVLFSDTPGSEATPDTDDFEPQ